MRDLPYLLANGDRMVLNDTRVIPARLVGERAETLGRWQGLYLESTRDGLWQILCKTRGRLNPGEIIRLFDREGRPGAELQLVEQLAGGEWLAKPASEEPALSVLERLGRVPLPPYIRGGNMVDADVANYQTVYARNPGAVAAPTAGLHLTRELLRSLAEHGVGATAVTLHVGLGTFRPIESEHLETHRMHSEWGEVTAAAAAEMNQARAQGGRVVAVGTTVVRLLETAVRDGGGGVDISLRETAPHAEREDYISISAWQGTTELFIRPPFEFQAVDALMTNFHFPRTTLLVLVQTFAGRELIAAAYEQAIREEYRFYSYGDAMLIV